MKRIGGKEELPCIFVRGEQKTHETPKQRNSEEQRSIQESRANELEETGVSTALKSFAGDGDSHRWSDNGVLRSQSGANGTEKSSEGDDEAGLLLGEKADLTAKTRLGGDSSFVKSSARCPLKTKTGNGRTEPRNCGHRRRANWASKKRSQIWSLERRSWVVT